MRIAAIVNPFAGSRAAARSWPLLLQSLGVKEKIVDTFWSEYPGHSESLAASARRSGYDRVIAVGGDGTLFEVLNGLWWEERGTMPSVGMAPFGTGCDYVRNFDIGKGMHAKLDTALGESTVTASLGRCRYELKGEIRRRVFAMVLGFGFDAQVIRRYQNFRFPRWNWLSYALSTLAELGSLRPFTLRGVIDDSPFQADAVFFGTALGCCFGKGIRVAPNASPTRRQLELVLAAPMSPPQLLAPVLRSYLGLDDKSPVVRRKSGCRVKLDSPMPIWMEADGELLGQTADIEIDVIPEAFRFAAGGITKKSRP